MAALSISVSGGPGDKAVTINTLTASDTFTYQTGDVLVWHNNTGGAAALTFTGSASAIVGVPGYGAVNAGVGRTGAGLANSAYQVIRLDDIWQYLQGTVTVTGASGSALMILRR